MAILGSPLVLEVLAPSLELSMLRPLGPLSLWDWSMARCRRLRLSDNTLEEAEVVLLRALGGGSSKSLSSEDSRGAAMPVCLDANTSEHAHVD